MQCVPSTRYTPLDPYRQQMPDDQDLSACAVEEVLREGVTALAALRCTPSAAPGGSGRAVSGSQQLAEVAPVVWQRFAAAAAQGDAVLLLAVLYALQPADIVAVFQHLLTSLTAALGSQVGSCIRRTHACVRAGQRVSVCHD